MHGTGPLAVPLGLCCIGISAQYRIAALGSQRSISSRSRFDSENLAAPLFEDGR